MKLLIIFSFALFLVQVATTEVYVFRFGQDIGRIIYTKEGSIPLLKYTTDVMVPVTPDTTVTYVEVTVRAISAPKVDYDAAFPKVTIRFNWTQIPVSTYSIVVKGM